MAIYNITHDGEVLDLTSTTGNILHVVNVNNFNDVSIMGGPNLTLNIKPGSSDNLTVSGGASLNIFGGDYTNANFWGGNSNSVQAYNASDYNFYGGAYKDTWEAGHSVNAQIYGNGGNDDFYVQWATDSHIYGGDGNDLAWMTTNVDISEYNIVKDGNGNVTFERDGSTLEFSGVEYFKIWVDQYYGYSDIIKYENLPCFLPQTLILTPSGEVRIDELKVGDLVTTTTGVAKPILWIGVKTVETRFAHPLSALPIRIAANALGHGLPRNDLYISPDHAIYITGFLVQAGALVNGSTITRCIDMPETFSYFHIELQDHDLIRAEGLPVETFIDNVSRESFDNGSEFVGRITPAAELEFPRVKSKRQLPRALAEELRDALPTNGSAPQREMAF